jgi:hypothetical protein
VSFSTTCGAAFDDDDGVQYPLEPSVRYPVGHEFVILSTEEAQVTGATHANNTARNSFVILISPAHI